MGSYEPASPTSRMQQFDCRRSYICIKKKKKKKSYSLSVKHETENSPATSQNKIHHAKAQATIKENYYNVRVVHTKRD